MTFTEALDDYREYVTGDPALGALERQKLLARAERHGPPDAWLVERGVKLDMAHIRGAAQALGARARLVVASHAAPPPPPTYDCATCKDAAYVYAGDEVELCPACKGRAVWEARAAKLRSDWRRRWPYYQPATEVVRTALVTDHFAGVLAGEDLEIAAQQLQAACRAAEVLAYDLGGPRLLVLDGPCGCGKTTLAKKICFAWWRRGMAAAFVTGGQLQRLAYEFDRDALRSLEQIDFLALDEANRALIGDQDNRAAEALFAIVDARLAHNRATVLTANDLLAALDSPASEATQSRLRGHDVQWIDMSSVPDARPYQQRRHRDPQS